MSYDLRFFSDFITKHFTTPGPSHIDTTYRQLKKQLNDHATHTINQMLAAASAWTEKHQQELFVSGQQTLIGIVLNRLEDALNFGPEPDMYEITDDPTLINLGKLLYIRMEEMIYLLHNHFAASFNFSLPLPLLYRKVNALDIRYQVRHVSGLLSKAGVGDDLLSKLIIPLERLAAPPAAYTPTYHQLYYLKSLLDDIYPIFLQPTVDKATLLIDLLHDHNFNSPAFRDYCTTAFSKELAAFNTQEEKKQKLLTLLSTVNRHFAIPGEIWIPGFPPLKDLLLLWLEDELNLLEGKLLPGTGPKLLTTEDPILKMQSAMTVPQMAHMLRLMVETGLYINIPTSDAIRFQSRNFTSRQSKQLSEGHLRQQYYTPDSPTAASVRDLLLKMIHHSKSLAP